MSFAPWRTYPDLTSERLFEIGAMICKARREVVKLNDSASGDNNWCLGCRGYSRMCHLLRTSADALDWLSVLPERESLRFTFAIGTIPVRFYHGDVSDPPSKFMGVSEAEQRQRQYILDFGIPLDSILRIAYETGPDHYVSRIALIEMNEDGDVTDTYDIPISDNSANNKVVP